VVYDSVGDIVYRKSTGDLVLGKFAAKDVTERPASGSGALGSRSRGEFQ